MDDERKTVMIPLIGGLIALVGAVVTEAMKLYSLDWWAIAFIVVVIVLVLEIVVLWYMRSTALVNLGDARERIRKLESGKVWAFEEIEHKPKTLTKGKDTAFCVKRERRNPYDRPVYKVVFSASQPVNFSIRRGDFLHWFTSGEEWEHAFVDDEAKGVMTWTKNYDFDSSLYCLFVAQLPEGVDEAKVSISVSEFVPIAPLKSGPKPEKP